MPEMTIKNGRVDLHVVTHGIDRGRAAPIILSHGFCASTHMWDKNVAALSRQRLVVTYDLRGHGETVTPLVLSEFTPEAAVTDIVAILDELSIDRAVVAGMSLGGYLSLAFHLAHPERVAALVLIDTGPGYRNEEARARWNKYAARNAQVFAERGLAALPMTVEVGPGPHDPRGLSLAATGILPQRDAAVLDSLVTVSVPTLVVVGADDAPFLAGSRYMASHIRLAELSIIDGAGHASNIDQAALFNEVVTSFLEGSRV